MKKNWGLFIDGDYRAAVSGKTFGVENPKNGEIFAEVAEGDAADIEAAIAAAERAFPAWAALTGAERGDIMHRAAEILRRRLPELVSIEIDQIGRARREMGAQLSRLPEWFSYFGAVARTHEDTVPPFAGQYLNYTRRVPLGVVGHVTPWNHPLLILTKKVAPSLAAGNAMVVKPSELAPITPLLLGEVLKEAGVPDGVYNVVPGFGATAGLALTSSRRIAKIDLTGGTETGRIVATAAAQRLIPATMELGGKAPVIVFDDTPLDEAVAGAAFAGFIASGQTCVAGTRFLIQETIYDAFVDRLAKKVSAFRLGDPLDRTTDMGPVISRSQFDQTLEYIESGLAEGARLVAGGKRAQMSGALAEGFFIEPTVFADVSPDNRIMREEIFGPVVCVLPFRDEADALRIANDHEFGLGASIWTRDIGRAHRVARGVQAGIVWINDHHKNDPASPWGGFGSSGYGKENGWNALHEYSKEQSVVVRLSPDFPDWYAGSDRYS